MSKKELDDLYRLGQSNNWEDQPAGRKDWQIAANWIRSEGGGARVLDIGCYDGRFLEFLGVGYTRFGIEIHQIAAGRAKQRGIQIIGTDYDDLKNQTEAFNVVTAMDVIEHVPDPKYFLKLLGNAIKPGGVIIISTGNTQALSWKLMGSRYWYCTFAEHISFVNPAWCRLIAGQAGLTVERVEHFSHSVRNKKRKLEELTKNIMYLSAPSLMRWLRKRGFGGKDVGKHLMLADHPPAWPTAKDHFIAVFRK